LEWNSPNSFSVFFISATSPLSVFVGLLELAIVRLQERHQLLAALDVGLGVGPLLGIALELVLGPPAHAQGLVLDGVGLRSAA
jgi:hypothetical protein